MKCVIPRQTAVANSSLKLWPVPAQGPLMLQFRPLQPGAYVAELLDIAGKKLMSWQGRAGAVTEQTIDVSAYPPGQYVLRIRCGNELMIRTFAVQH